MRHRHSPGTVTGTPVPAHLSLGLCQSQQGCNGPSLQDQEPVVWARVALLCSSVCVEPGAPRWAAGLGPRGGISKRNYRIMFPQGALFRPALPTPCNLKEESARCGGGLSSASGSGCCPHTVVHSACEGRAAGGGITGPHCLPAALDTGLAGVCTLESGS